MQVKPKNNKKKWIIIGLVVVLALLTIAVAMKAKNKPKGTAVEMEEVAIRTIKETVSASGKIYPEKEIKISSDVSGEVVELYVKEGDSVVVGQVLARIDPEAFVSSVERGVQGVNTSKSQLSVAKAQIESNRAQAEQIRAQLENARGIHIRNEQLKKEGVISALEYDQSLSNLQSLEANLKAAEASIRSAERNAEGAAYGVKSNEASLKELRTSLNRTTIKSPVSGIVSSLFIEKGERVVGTIQMAGTELMRISNLHNMEVQVDVTENDIPKVKLGNDVEIDVDAYSTMKFKGTVREIASSAKNITSAAGAALNTDQVTNFVVKISINKESYTNLVKAGNKYPFRPGMSASVDIFTQTRENVLSVPIQSVAIREKDKTKDKSKKEMLTDADFEEVVFVVKSDSISKTPVKIGIQDDEYIEIKSGLAKDALIVTGPYNEISKNLKNGDKVRRKEVKKEDEEEKKD